MNRKLLLQLSPAAAAAMASAVLMMMNRADAARAALMASICLAVLGVSPAYRARAVGRTGLSRTRGAQSVRSTLTFRDVAANETAMNHLRALADYLSHPEKYAALGARLPRGVLLYGPPGTGKTLMARALAGEAGVPFYSMNGSDFVEMYVGVGAARVRELFSKAAKEKRCVIFIDEIDAIGKKRDDGAGSDERDRTLNALLSEMSGFAENSGVIVLAATNRVDTLDPALTRPGRFDAKIEVGLPGRSERLDILKLHCRRKPLAGDVDLGRLAADTVRFSGASLESLVNDAAIRAARRGSSVIEESDLHTAFVAAVAGEDRPAFAAREELAVIALHEAGHALACRLLLPAHRIERVSILPASNGAAGYNLTIPAERALPDMNALTAQLQVLLAGRAAEQLLVSETNLTAGASGDLAQATELASAMVLDLGFAGSPAVSLRALSKCTGSGSQDAAALVKRLLDDCYQAVRALLGGHIGLLEALTGRLLEAESLSGREAEAFFEEAGI
ncbi:MAG: AAA family ATPase [Clostridia bacterium]|nr:AAA family ATPase [Clostridia bacterium]